MEDFVGAGELLDEPDEAAALATAVSQLRQRLGLPRSPRREKRWQSVVHQLEAHLPAERLDAAMGRGMAWTLDEAIRHALRLSEQAAA
jgi:hypothetical protein